MVRMSYTDRIRFKKIFLPEVWNKIHLQMIYYADCIALPVPIIWKTVKSANCIIRQIKN